MINQASYGLLDYFSSCCLHHDVVLILIFKVLFLLAFAVERYTQISKAD